MQGHVVYIPHPLESMKLFSLSLLQYEPESWPKAPVNTQECGADKPSLVHITHSRMDTAKETAGEESEVAVYIESTWYKERKKGCPRAQGKLCSRQH